MIKVRKFMSVVILLAMTACSTSPGDAPGPQTQEKKPEPTPTLMPVKPGTLEGSILAGHWIGNHEGHLLVPIDPATGQALADYEPISLGQNYSYAFSPDGRMLAVVGYVSSQHPNGGSLHLIDLETWQDHVQELRLDAYINAMDFSSDGEKLAIAYGNSKSQVFIIDATEPFVKSKASVQEISLDFYVNQMKFTSDGSGLMVYGYRTENPSTVNEANPYPPTVVSLESPDLSPRWQADLEGIRHGIVPKDETSGETIDFTQPGQAIYLFPGLTFAPERDTLYVVHADKDKLTTVDFSAQTIDSVEITPELSWMDRLLGLTAGVARAKVAEGTSKHVAISPDGKFLYIVGLQSD
jgi:WD40 repeat protein